MNAITHKNTSYEESQNGDSQDEISISLTEILALIKKRKRLLLIIPLVTACLVATYMYLQPNIYTAQTAILPPSQSGGIALSGELASLAGLAGVKSQSASIVDALLGSTTLKTNLIKRFNLQKRYDTDKLSDTINALKKNTVISTDKKNGLVTISVSDVNAEFSATLANAYVSELREMSASLTLTEAQKSRKFFESRINETKGKLVEAELFSKRAQETSGIISLDAQTAGKVKTMEELRAQITVSEVRLQALRSFATEENPEVLRLSSEIKALEAKLARLEDGSGASSKLEKRSDTKALANLRAFREVKYQETLLENLIKQFELARIDEAREGPLLQQIDIATPPDRKSGPKRLIITLVTLMASFFITFLYFFCRDYLFRPTSAP